MSSSAISNMPHVLVVLIVLFSLFVLNSAKDGRRLADQTLREYHRLPRQIDAFDLRNLPMKTNSLSGTKFWMIPRSRRVVFRLGT